MDEVDLAEVVDELYNLPHDWELKVGIGRDTSWSCETVGVDRPQDHGTADLSTTFYATGRATVEKAAAEVMVGMRSHYN